MDPSYYDRHAIYPTIEAKDVLRLLKGSLGLYSLERSIRRHVQSSIARVFLKGSSSGND